MVKLNPDWGKQLPESKPLKERRIYNDEELSGVSKVPDNLTLASVLRSFLASFLQDRFKACFVTATTVIDLKL